MEATKIQKGEVKTLHFTVTGEGMTNTIRDSWVSDMPKHALAICESLSMNTEQALEVITGKKRLTGDTRVDEGLDWEDDNTTEVSGIKLDVQTMVDRLEKKYIDASEGLNLLNGNYEVLNNLIYNFRGNIRDDEDMEDNEKSLGYYKSIISSALEQLEVVYPLVGKSMKDLPINKVRSASKIIQEAKKQQTKEDFEERKNNTENIFQENLSLVMKTELKNMNQEETEESEEQEIELTKEEKRDKVFYTNMMSGSNPFYIVNCSVEKCKDENLYSGFLLPDGTFFGGRGIWIHRCILDELAEYDFFKDKDYTNDEDSVQDKGGWIKVSGGDWMIWEHKHKPTKEQIEFIISFTTEVRETAFISINSFNKIHIQVFAELLNGREFESFKMAEESKELPELEKENNNFPSLDDIEKMDVMCSIFFQPDNTFIKWLVEYANGRVIIDCGAGTGYTTALINRNGGKAIAIEPMWTIERKMFWIKNDINFHVFPEKAETCSMIKDLGGDKAVLLFARPCHSGFVEATINIMPKGMEALYISHTQENVLIDLGSSKQIKRTKLEHRGTSKGKEFVLSIKK